MKNRFTLFIGVLLVLMLLAFMFCFQVRYNQATVLTTFGKAAPGSVKTEPGLYRRLPWPIQTVHAYDTRLRVLDVNLEQIQTADNYSIVVRLYLAWKIADPLAFYNADFKTPEAAQERLRPLVQNLLKVVSKYRFDELVNTDPRKLKINDLEDEALAALRAQLASLNYGIEARRVGIRRVVLPDASTKQVFDRMRKTREALAARIEQDGKAEATRITSEAESMKNRILTFANRRAQEVRTQGKLEEAGYYEAFKSDPQLAIFLERVEALKEVLKKNTTFVIDINQLSELNLFAPQAQPAPRQ